MSLLLLLSVGLAIVGLVLLIIGRRGRRLDDHPVCRKCWFDLTGTPEPRAACPECGADLTAKRAQRTGNRRRRPGLAWTGVVFLVIAALPVGLMVGGVNWNPYKPLWLLRYEARATSSIGAESALIEINHRLQAGRFSNTTMRTLLDDALTVQADRGRPWLEGWGDVVGEVYRAGNGRPDQYKRFAKQYCKTGIEIREQARKGERLPIFYHYEDGRGDGAQTRFYLKIHHPALTIGRIKRPQPRHGWSSSGGNGAGVVIHDLIRMQEPPLNRVPLGKHTLKLTQHVDFYLGSLHGKKVTGFDVKAQSPLKIVSPDTRLVTLVKDNAAAQQVWRTLAVQQVAVKPTPGNRRGYPSSQANGQSPIPVAFEVTAKAGDRSWDLGQCTGVDWFGGAPDLLPREADGVKKVDLHFRPSREVARTRSMFTRILDCSFVIRDVPVDSPPYNNALQRTTAAATSKGPITK